MQRRLARTLLVTDHMSRIGIAGTLLAVAIPASASPLDEGTKPQPLQTTSGVIGGTQAPAGKWPDAVAVLGAQGACTGTLIAPDVAITAGHCAEVNPTTVIANSTDYAAQGGIKATVKSITAYPSWETTYDVSVIVLTAPVAGVTPRKVGTSCTFDQDFKDNTMVHLVGFGLTDTAGQGNNTKLNEALAPVTDADCSGPGGCAAAVSPGGEFIAGGGGKDSCFGDSGGPVYLDTPRGTVVVGAVSRGLDGAATPCGGGGIYVRTDKIVAWIEQTAGKSIEKDLCATGPGGTDPNPDPGGDDPPGTNDPESPDDGGDIGGGCSTSGGSGGALLALGFVLALRRRR